MMYSFSSRELVHLSMAAILLSIYWIVRSFHKIFCNLNVSLNHFSFFIDANKWNFSVLMYHSHCDMLLSLFHMTCILSTTPLLSFIQRHGMPKGGPGAGACVPSPVLERLSQVSCILDFRETLIALCGINNTACS